MRQRCCSNNNDKNKQLTRLHCVQKSFRFHLRDQIYESIRNTNDGNEKKENRYYQFNMHVGELQNLPQPPCISRPSQVQDRLEYNMKTLRS